MNHSKINPDAPAFPNYGPDNNVYDRTIVRGGMSIRTYLVGQAIAGMCASDYWCMNAVAENETYTKALAVAALAVADAALKALDDNNVKK